MASVVPAFAIRIFSIEVMASRKPASRPVSRLGAGIHRRFAALA
jgi:hypothetical protein